MLEQGSQSSTSSSLRQPLREIFVKQLRLPLDLDPKQISPDDRNDHALGDGLEQLAPLFRIVIHLKLFISALALTLAPSLLNSAEIVRNQKKSQLRWRFILL